MPLNQSSGEGKTESCGHVPQLGSSTRTAGVRRRRYLNRLLFGRWGVNLRDLRTSLHDWHFDNLPRAFEGTRILHISDLHMDVADGIVERVVEKMMQLEYDFCAITGDFRDQMGKRHDKMVRRGIEAIAEAAKSDVFFTLGNHDNPEVEDWAVSAGMISLVNRRVDVDKGGGRIVFCGVGDCIRHQNHDFRKLGELPRDTVSILLSHSPELAANAEEAGVDFMMAGHTHGGQVCLPGGVPIFTGGASRALSSGRWRHGRIHGYTSRGVGGSLFALRVNCPPEIAIHRLCRKVG